MVKPRHPRCFPKTIRQRWPRLLALGSVVLILLSVGCGQKKPETCEVSGSVTWQGKPVAKGDIIVLPSDGSASPAAGKIMDGKYTLRAKPGMKRVEIHASRETGEFDQAANQPVRESYIPERFNSASTLSAEVTADGKNHFDFSLE